MTDSIDTKKTALDRRSLLGRSAAVVGGVAASQMLLARPVRAQGKPTKSAGANKGFTLSAMGEAMVGRRFAADDNPEFLALVKQLRESDVGYCHLETNLADDDELSYAPRGSAGASGYLVTDGDTAKDFAWAGIDVMSTGMNHSFDWGPEGILATIRHCHDAGIACAGTGKNLEVARAPAYFMNEKGRMAMVSVSSGNSPFEWAGLPKGAVPGRPGVNPLRVLTTIEVPKAAADQMKDTAQKAGIMSKAAAAKPNFTMGGGAVSGSNGFSGTQFAEGTEYAIHSQSHPADLKGNLRSVAEARAQADYVMVAHHNSTSEGARSQDPSEFVVDFARKSIDAGADVYFGHGWHSFVGIEIYKGKPIIYGMGSMFVQSNFMSRVPADQYESYGFDMDQLTTFNMASENLHPGGGSDWGWSALYQLRYDNNLLQGRSKLVEIVLYPVECGWDYSQNPPKKYRVVGVGDHEYVAGSPRLATGASGAKILEMLKAVNARRNTAMTIRNGVGVITVA
ncbi:CapA family protein [Novosphingobium resinovorum]|uniref:CapA family protein n=1 Tax=Novosphingobium resinovorum TaxID=158500 RepID=UPI002ED43112|nr:CapA family protein [Novosphingobium resinovorum]